MCENCGQEKEMSRPVRIALATLILGLGLLLLIPLLGGYTIDIGKMYKEYRAKQRLDEFQKSSPRLTFLEHCKQQKLECAQSTEHGKGYVAQSAEVFYPFWENKTEGTSFRFGWQNSQRVFNSEQGGYRSSENFWTAGPKFTSKSGARDIPVPPKEPNEDTPPAR